MAYPLVAGYVGARRPWLDDLIAAFASAQPVLDSRSASRPTSTAADAREELRPRLTELGYELGEGPRANVMLPVSTKSGHSRGELPVDAHHLQHRVVLEIDAGRAAQSNTSYRALIRASLLDDIRHLVLAVPIHYRYRNAGRLQLTAAFDQHAELLAAVEDSPRLSLPFHSITVIGW